MTFKTVWVTIPVVQKPKRGRGFAALDAEARREVSSRGGKAVHEQGRSYSFTSATARAAAAKSSRRKGKGKT